MNDENAQASKQLYKMARNHDQLHSPLMWIRCAYNVPYNTKTKHWETPRYSGLMAHTGKISLNKK